MQFYVVCFSGAHISHQHINRRTFSSPEHGMYPHLLIFAVPRVTLAQLPLRTRFRSFLRLLNAGVEQAGCLGTASLLGLLTLFIAFVMFSTFIHLAVSKYLYVTIYALYFAKFILLPKPSPVMLNTSSTRWDRGDGCMSSVLTTQREGPRPGPQHPAQGGPVGSCPHCTIYLVLLTPDT